MTFNWKFSGHAKPDESIAATDRDPGVFHFLKRAILAGVVLFLFLYYGLCGFFLMHKIDDNIKFEVVAEAPQSKAVAMLIGLIDREVNVNGWRANDPWFYPGSVLDNMPNYQMGMIYATKRFTDGLADYIGRTRSSTQVDPALDKARGKLAFDGRQYIISTQGFGFSAESQYNDAIVSLRDYNLRLERGQAVFDKRSDNLVDALKIIISDLGSQCDVTERQINEGAYKAFDFKSDDVYYQNKGRLYAYYKLFEALGEDYKTLLETRGLTHTWQNVIVELREAAMMDPYPLVVNFSTHGWIQANSLANQGFYLQRSRDKLREVISTLSNS